jgi:uncharacterized protein YukE
MLKRFLTILIIFVLGGWGISQYFELHSKEDISKVFSRVTTVKQIPEFDINAVDIIEYTNKERVAVGLPPLATNTLLDASAEIKVDDMIARQYFEHQSPTGEGVSDLGKEVGYEYVIMGENLAMGTFLSSAEIVQAWMDSPGHKANILNTKYQDIGVSVKRGVFEDKEVWFAVQHFGTNRSVCPSVNISLKKEIDQINAELKKEEGSISALKKTLEGPGAASSPSYQSDVQTFNKKVDAYNAKLQISRVQISKYNVQVKEFNRCIATFQ